MPLRYELALTLDPDADDYAGSVGIDVRIVAPTDLVWINATRLQILEVRAVVGSASPDGIPATLVAGDDDFVGLQFAAPLPIGDARLELRFKGSFSTADVAGLFKQKDAGDWYVLTQMEPMYARRAFPCFDEPRFRAAWRIVVTVPEAERAFANMPVESERIVAPGWREVSFRESPPIVSYLVAIAVGPWDVLDGGTAGRNATPLRYITPRGRAAEAAYAASITPQIVERLEAYFGQAYPFAKLDSMVIPDSGHFFGAMENVGLITYDQALLLATADAMTTRFQQNYTATAAHEISHQWFGNLVTPVWWNDIWLNESFATWLGTRITAELKPEWNWPFRRLGTRQWAIDSDRLASARRVRQPIEVRSDVRSAFDGISYGKGASVLAMFEDWLGPDKFRAGVQRYMTRHAWGVASADDFFAALAAEDPAVLPAFHGFVDRPGVPLISIALDCRGAPRLTLRQSRFLSKGSAGDSAQTWVFPACFQFGDAKKGRSQCTLIKDEVTELNLDSASCPQWLVGNRDGIGYFVSALSPALYAAVPKAAGVLGPMDWFALLSDTNSLATSAVVPLPDALMLSALASKQQDARIFGEALGIAAAVPAAVTQAADERRYAAWVRANFSARARSLGWQGSAGEDADTQRLRRMALPFVADRGADAVLAREARERAARWPQDPTAVPAAIRDELLYTAAHTAGRDADALFAHLVAAAQASRVATERRDILKALGGFRDPALARQAAELMLTGGFNAQEALIILAAQLDDPATRAGALAWVDANYDALFARGAQDNFGELPSWADGGCSAEERTRFVSAFGERMAKVDGGPRSYAKALERIDLCIVYRTMQEPLLSAWLKTGAAGGGLR
jgi:cytosol alanyl aminopeptidase